jgi:hypothetical protein
MTRSKIITIAFNNQLLTSVTEAAKALHMNRAQYIRYVLAKELNSQNKPAVKEADIIEGLFQKLTEEDD